MEFKNIFISIVLISLVLVSLSGCDKKDSDTTPTTPTGNQPSTPTTPTTPAVEKPNLDAYKLNYFKISPEDVKKYGDQDPKYVEMLKMIDKVMTEESTKDANVRSCPPPVEYRTTQVDGADGKVLTYTISFAKIVEYAKEEGKVDKAIIEVSRGKVINNIPAKPYLRYDRKYDKFDNCNVQLEYSYQYGTGQIQKTVWSFDDMGRKLPTNTIINV